MFKRTVLTLLCFLGTATLFAKERSQKLEVITRQEVDGMAKHTQPCIYWLQNDAASSEFVFVVQSASAPVRAVLKVDGQLVNLETVAGDSACDKKKTIEQKFLNKHRSATLKAKYWGGNKFGGDVYQGELKVSAGNENRIAKVEGECVCFDRRVSQ